MNAASYQISGAAGAGSPASDAQVTPPRWPPPSGLAWPRPLPAVGSLTPRVRTEPPEPRVRIAPLAAGSMTTSTRRLAGGCPAMEADLADHRRVPGRPACSTPHPLTRGHVARDNRYHPIPAVTGCPSSVVERRRGDRWAAHSGHRAQTASVPYGLRCQRRTNEPRLVSPSCHG